MSSESRTSGKSLDIRAICELLPHRYPFLLVDRAEIIEEGKRIRGIKNVTFNEPFFVGHFPGEPIMPGVLIVEATAQVGALLLLSMDQFRGMIPMVGAIDNTKFRRPVVPGDQLAFEVEIVWLRGTIGKCKGDARVDGQVVATFEMTFKLRPREEPVSS